MLCGCALGKSAIEAWTTLKTGRKRRQTEETWDRRDGRRDRKFRLIGENLANGRRGRGGTRRRLTWSREFFCYVCGLVFCSTCRSRSACKEIP